MDAAFSTSASAFVPVELLAVLTVAAVFAVTGGISLLIGNYFLISVQSRLRERLGSTYDDIFPNSSSESNMAYEQRHQYLDSRTGVSNAVGETRTGFAIFGAQAANKGFAAIVDTLSNMRAALPLIAGMVGMALIGRIWRFTHSALIKGWFTARQCGIQPFMETFVLRLTNMLRFFGNALVVPYFNLVTPILSFYRTGHWRILLACTSVDDIGAVFRAAGNSVAAFMTALNDWLTSSFLDTRIELVPTVYELSLAVDAVVNQLSCFCPFFDFVFVPLLSLTQKSALHAGLDFLVNAALRVVQLVPRAFVNLSSPSFSELTEELVGMVLSAGEFAEDVVLVGLGVIDDILAELSDLIGLTLSTYVTETDGVSTASNVTRAHHATSTVRDLLVAASVYRANRMASLDDGGYASMAYARVAPEPIDHMGTAARIMARVAAANGSTQDTSLGAFMWLTRVHPPLQSDVINASFIFFDDPENIDLSDLIGLSALLRVAAEPWSKTVTGVVASGLTLINGTLELVTHPIEAFASGPSGLAYMQVGVAADYLRDAADGVSVLLVLIDEGLPVVGAAYYKLPIGLAQSILEILPGWLMSLVYPGWEPPFDDCGVDGALCTYDDLPTGWSPFDFFPAYIDWPENRLIATIVEVGVVAENASQILGCTATPEAGHGPCDERPLVCILRSAALTLVEVARFAVTAFFYTNDLVQFTEAPHLKDFGDLDPTPIYGQLEQLCGCLSAWLDTLDDGVDNGSGESDRCWVPNQPPGRRPPGFGNDLPELVDEEPLPPRTSYDCDVDGRAYHTATGVAVTRYSLYDNGVLRINHLRCHPLANAGCLILQFNDATESGAFVEATGAAPDTSLRTYGSFFAGFPNPTLMNTIVVNESNSYNLVPNKTFTGDDVISMDVSNCSIDYSETRYTPLPDGLACRSDAETHWRSLYLDPRNTLTYWGDMVFRYSGPLTDDPETVRESTHANQVVGCRITYPPTFECVEAPGDYDAAEYQGKPLFAIAPDPDDNNLLKPYFTVYCPTSLNPPAAETFRLYCLANELFYKVPPFDVMEKQPLLPIRHADALNEPIPCDIRDIDGRPPNYRCIDGFAHATSQIANASDPSEYMPLYHRASGNFLPCTLPVVDTAVPCLRLNTTYAPGNTTRPNSTVVDIHGAEVRVAIDGIRNEGMCLVNYYDYSATESMTNVSAPSLDAFLASTTLITPGTLAMYARLADRQRLSYADALAQARARAYFTSWRGAMHTTDAFRRPAAGGMSVSQRELLRFAHVLAEQNMTIFGTPLNVSSASFSPMTHAENKYRKDSFVCALSDTLKAGCNTIQYTSRDLVRTFLLLLQLPLPPHDQMRNMPAFNDTSVTIKVMACRLATTISRIIGPGFSCGTVGDGFRRINCKVVSTCTANVLCDVFDIPLMATDFLSDLLKTVRNFLGDKSGDPDDSPILGPLCSSTDIGSCFRSVIMYVVQKVGYTATNLLRSAAELIDCTLCALLTAVHADCTAIVSSVVRPIANLIDKIIKDLLSGLLKIIIGAFSMIVYLITIRLKAFIDALVNDVLVGIGDLAINILKVFISFLLELPVIGEIVQFFIDLLKGACNFIEDAINAFAEPNLDLQCYVFDQLKRYAEAAMGPGWMPSFAESRIAWRDPGDPNQCRQRLAFWNSTTNNFGDFTLDDQRELLYCLSLHWWVPVAQGGRLPDEVLEEPIPPRCDYFMMRVVNTSLGERAWDSLSLGEQSDALECVKLRMFAERGRMESNETNPTVSWIRHDFYYNLPTAQFVMLEDMMHGIAISGQYASDHTTDVETVVSSEYRAQWAARGYPTSHLDNLASSIEEAAANNDYDLYATLLRSAQVQIDNATLSGNADFTLDAYVARMATMPRAISGSLRGYNPERLLNFVKWWRGTFASPVPGETYADTASKKRATQDTDTPQPHVVERFLTNLTNQLSMQITPVPSLNVLNYMGALEAGSHLPPYEATDRVLREGVRGGVNAMLYELPVFGLKLINDSYQNIGMVANAPGMALDTLRIVYHGGMAMAALSHRFFMGTMATARYVIDEATFGTVGANNITAAHNGTWAPFQWPILSTNETAMSYIGSAMARSLGISMNTLGQNAARVGRVVGRLRRQATTRVATLGPRYMSRRQRLDTLVRVIRNEVTHTWRHWALQGRLGAAAAEHAAVMNQKSPIDLAENAAIDGTWVPPEERPRRVMQLCARAPMLAANETFSVFAGQLECHSGYQFLCDECPYADAFVDRVQTAVLGTVFYFTATASESTASYAYGVQQYDVHFNYLKNRTLPARVGDSPELPVGWPHPDYWNVRWFGDATPSKIRFTDLDPLINDTLLAVRELVGGDENSSIPLTVAPGFDFGTVSRASLHAAGKPPRPSGIDDMIMDAWRAATRSMVDMIDNATLATDSVKAAANVSLADLAFQWLETTYETVLRCEYTEELDGTKKRFALLESALILGVTGLVTGVLVHALLAGYTTMASAMAGSVGMTVALSGTLILTYNWSYNCFPALPYQLINDVHDALVYQIFSRCPWLESGFIREDTYTNDVCASCSAYTSGTFSVVDCFDEIGFKDVGYNLGFIFSVQWPAAGRWLRTAGRTFPILGIVLDLDAVKARLAAWDHADMTDPLTFRQLYTCNYGGTLFFNANEAMLVATTAMTLVWPAATALASIAWAAAAVAMQLLFVSHASMQALMTSAPLIGQGATFVKQGGMPKSPGITSATQKLSAHFFRPMRRRPRRDRGGYQEGGARNNDDEVIPLVQMMPSRSRGPGYTRV